MALSLLAGAVAVLGMAPFNLWPVMMAALAALFLLVDGAAMRPRPVRTAALTGWAFGFGYFGLGLYWIGEAFYVDPSTIWMMPFAVTLLPAFLALFHAAACAFARMVPRRGAGGALVLTASFCLVEFTRGWIFTGFPWNLFGSAFIDTGIGQAAAIGGVYGLTFLALLTSFALAPAVVSRTPGQAAPLLAGLILLAGAQVFGALRPPVTGDTGVMVRIVQPDNPQTEKGRNDYVARLWRRLTMLTTGPGADAIDVFIWPEGVTPFFLDETPEALLAIGDMLIPGQILIAGSARRELLNDGGTRYYNAMLVIDDEGRVIEIYDKAHLVPFGEYLPFPDAFRSLGIASLTARIGGAFTPGPGLRTLAPAGVPAFGALVCYESLFPGAVVEPGKRPSWLVNITDDSWFGTQTGPHQHLTAARFRAIEEGLPLLRAATTGISAVMDAQGAIVASKGLQTAGTIDSRLPSPAAATFFAIWGHWLYAALVLCAALAAGICYRPRGQII
jgi:apolipoprotein N-acyltransferase